VIRRLAGRLARALGFERSHSPTAKHGKTWTEDLRTLVENQAKLVLFDVGASVGQTVRLYRQVFPQAEIHSFEPHPPSYQALCENTRGDDHVHLHQLAVSDGDGQCTLHVCSIPVASSIFAFTAERTDWVPPSVDEVAEISVHHTSIDTFCKTSRIPRIDVLKIDVQGAELKVLEGARRMLREQAIDIVYCEVFMVGLYESQSWFWDVCKHMSALGYSFFGLYDMKRDTATGQQKWGDAMFLSRSVQQRILSRRRSSGAH